MKKKMDPEAVFHVIAFAVALFLSWLIFRHAFDHQIIKQVILH
jgi:hypothetical protein